MKGLALRERCLNEKKFKVVQDYLKCRQKYVVVFSMTSVTSDKGGELRGVA